MKNETNTQNKKEDAMTKQQAEQAGRFTADVAAYEELKKQIADLEARKDELKAKIEGAISNNEFSGTTLDGRTVRMTECTRETVDLKAARLVLREAVEPFVKTSFYTQLRISKN